MITFRELDGAYCPVFICDECGEPIQGDQRGLIQWNDYVGPTFTALHKGPWMPCSRSWESRHGGRGSWIGWRELSTFIDQLSYNTAHPFTQDQSSSLVK
jgi:hypothetical protein